MTTSGRNGFLRSLNKENDESPAVPSEASVRTEPICEHRRNRCPKSALGLAVDATIPVEGPSFGTAAIPRSARNDNGFLSCPLRRHPRPGLRATAHGSIARFIPMCVDSKPRRS